MRPLLCLAFVSILAFVGCEGPKESAGREQDRVIAANSAVPLSGAGPNQRLGEAQDRTDRADAKARDARAEALESEANRLRTQADIAADRLDLQAKAVRSGEAK